MADLPTHPPGSIEAFAALIAGQVVAAQRAQRVVTHQQAGALVAGWLASRLSRHTVRAYRGALDAFAAWINTPVEAAVSGLLSGGRGEARALLLRWRGEMRSAGAAPGSVNHRLACVRSLILYAHESEVIDWPPPRVPGLLSDPLRDTRGPGRAGVARMLDVLATRSGAKATRDTALVRLMFDLGLRVGEVCSLDVDHVLLEDHSVLVLGKGRHVRERLPLPGPTCGALAAWVALRGDAEGALFVSTSNHAPDGRRLAERSAYNVVRELGRAAGLGLVRPHGLRHAAITAALEATGGDVTKAAAFSRHKKIQTLTIYDDRRRGDAGAIANLVALPD